MTPRYSVFDGFGVKSPAGSILYMLNPFLWELVHTSSHCSKQYDAFVMIDGESIRSKYPKDIIKVGKSSVTCWHAFKLPSEMNVVSIYYQVVVYPLMWIGSGQVYQYQMHTKNPQDKVIPRALSNTSGGSELTNQLFMRNVVFVWMQKGCVSWFWSPAAGIKAQWQVPPWSYWPNQRLYLCRGRPKGHQTGLPLFGPCYDINSYRGQSYSAELPEANTLLCLYWTNMHIIANTCVHQTCNVTIVGWRNRKLI